jgi:ATP-dependent DNA ligase
MLRNPNATYKYGRSTPKSQDLVKLKPFQDSEAIVLGVYEAMFNGNEAVTNALGHTERSTHKENLSGKGMLGGFHVRDLHTGVEFDCAPGKSSHAERTEWWNSKPVGKILKYRFLPVGIKDKPRHCRFIGWRDMRDM